MPSATPSEQRWPATGVPASPEAWLLVAARRRLIDAARARNVRTEATLQLVPLLDEVADESPAIPDQRLALLFVCAHPAIDAAARTPLMLQTVLGLDAATIARCFLVAPATMGQRLVRAKTRIRTAGLRFELPGPDDLAPRAAAVREAIYAVYGTAWDAVPAADERVRGLAEEAIWLARVLVEVMPDDAEAKGLLALLAFLDARQAARRDECGRFVPLDRQDPRRWRRTRLVEAETILGEAARLGRPGRFQLEAAIQSALVEGRLAGRSPARAVLALHGALLALAPTIANQLAYVAALAAVEGPAAGLQALATLDDARLRDHQPFWALRAHLLAGVGDPDAAAAYGRAAGLSHDPAVRAFLLERATG